MFSQETVDNYTRVTKFPIQVLLDSFVAFIDSDYANITAYYLGDIKKPNAPSFDRLKKLQKDTKTCINLFVLHKGNFDTIDYWELLDKIEEIRTKLDTVENIGFYSRSNLNKNQFTTNIELDRPLKQSETLESMVEREFNSIDYQNDWIDIALYNTLGEEDYTYEGKKILKLVFDQNQDKYFLESVLGKLQGELLYGIDFDKRFHYVNNDRAILSPKDTIRQAITILLNLKKGDNPQFKDHGLVLKSLIGNSLAGLNIPILFRQLVSNFKKDDTIYSIAIIDLNQVTDSLEVYLEIQTKFGDVYKDKILI